MQGSLVRAERGLAELAGAQARDRDPVERIMERPTSMNIPALWRRRQLVGLLGAAALPALAQFRVEVTGVGLTQLPIAIAPFRGEAQAPQKIAAIVQADLERSGQFRAIDAAGAALDETSRPDVTPWRQKGADSLAAGSVSRLADGRYDVRFRLWDVVRGQDLGGQSYAVTAGDLRLAAHRIADYIYEKLTGEKGVFSTRIAYVTKAGNRYNLWVADADGENAQSALASGEPIISPAWSANGDATRLCVVRIAQAGGLRARRGQRQAPADRQLPRLQQRAGLVARRPHAGRDAQPRCAARSSTPSTPTAANRGA